MEIAEGTGDAQSEIEGDRRRERLCGGEGVERFGRVVDGRRSECWGDGVDMWTESSWSESDLGGCFTEAGSGLGRMRRR